MDGPKKIPEYAKVCLEALSSHGLGEKISVGGGVGLLHFLAHRTTRDVDAWWSDGVGESEKEKVVKWIEEALSPYGKVRRRSWGEVISLELIQEGKKAFSFQIARRSARLKPPQWLPWVKVQVDSLEDLLASKMVALVERGAPRDFLDIYAFCRAGRTTPTQCWDLWRKRQKMSGSDTDVHRARLAIQTHLARIETQRPLESLEAPEERKKAGELRSWFHGEFLDALPDR